MRRTMNFRKKPVIIEAYQTDRPMDIETLEGVMHADTATGGTRKE